MRGWLRSFSISYTVNKPVENKDRTQAQWFSTNISYYSHSKTWFNHKNKNHLFHRRTSKFEKHKH